MVRPLLSTVDLAHIPEGLRVHVALFQNLKNSRYLRKQLIDQNTEFEYAFIDARKILSTTHLLAAVFRAVNDKTNDRLKSHNVHSEIVVSLNLTNNYAHPRHGSCFNWLLTPTDVRSRLTLLQIGDALRKFGISDQTRSLLVVKVAPLEAAEGIAAQLDQAVEGEPLEFNDTELAKLHDLPEIRKAYKIGSGSTVKGKEAAASKDAANGHLSEKERADLEMSILGSMALRGAT